jgi:hypothetical protein
MTLRITCLLLSFLFYNALLTGCSSSEQAVSHTAPGEYIIYPDRPSPDHTGMWMFSQAEGNLHGKMRDLGLKLLPRQIYDPVQPSLNQAIVRINIGDEGGGTGSFVSPQGLILTNHHVAYDGIASLSLAGENYLDTGFYAEREEDELPLNDFTLYIPIEQTEVTGFINERLPDNIDHQRRSQIHAEIVKELIEDRRKDDNDLIVEVDDFWSGNRQFMSVYRIIRDVRLVYAPEEAIGKFGGDIDNWMWPRHTGDFTFLRAYVSPDGISEPYQPSNVPFEPDWHLPFRAAELKPGDFTLVAGFPGSTYRYESSHAFSFYEQQQFPALQKAFSAYLNGLEFEAATDSAAAVYTASERASIANALKYFEGVQSGFERYNVTRQKRNMDRELTAWIEADSLRNVRFGRVLPQLRQSYDIASQTGDILYLSFYAIQYSNLLQMGSLFNDFHEYSLAPDSLFFSSDDRQRLHDQVRMWYSVINPEAEILILTEMLQAMAELPEERRPLILFRFFGSGDADSMKEDISRFMQRQATTSALTDTSIASRWIYTEMQFSEEAFQDSLYLISKDLFETFEMSRDNYFQHFRYLEPAQKLYVQATLEKLQKPDHYPDANFTLRFSAGQVWGYSPADGIYHTPLTTMQGKLDKHRGKEPFNVPYRIRSHSFVDEQKNRLKLNFLSTNDITGGNSGSPVLNGDGEIIGVAFDGNIEGIVSDYFVVPDVARTISIDSRYILFMMEEIDGTQRLLEEIEIRR